MESSSLSSLFIGMWVVGIALALISMVATWKFRLPGTTFSDIVRGPLGPGAPRLFFSAADRLLLVRPERRRLVYALQLAGVSIVALAVVVVPLLEFLLSEANK
jgi:hypothetical protein